MDPEILLAELEDAQAEYDDAASETLDDEDLERCRARVVAAEEALDRYGKEA
jgi:hypothetical protein